MERHANSKQKGRLCKAGTHTGDHPTEMQHFLPTHYENVFVRRNIFQTVETRPGPKVSIDPNLTKWGLKLTVLVLSAQIPYYLIWLPLSPTSLFLSLSFSIPPQVHKKDKKYKCMVCKKIFMLAASVGIRHGSRRYGVCADCADSHQATQEGLEGMEFPRDEDFEGEEVEDLEGEEPTDNDQSNWGEGNTGGAPDKDWED